jgi:small subunit ribosomal protein S6
MEKYELLYIIPAKYTDAEIASLMEKVKGMVTTAGGNVSEMHNLGKRKLAYPINHVRHGNYILNYFEAEPEMLAKLNDTLRLSTDVVRHLVTARDKYLTNIPSLAEVEAPIGREEGERPRPMAPPVQKPIPAAAVKDPMSMEELDKKLDEILTEEVL